MTASTRRCATRPRSSRCCTASICPRSTRAKLDAKLAPLDTPTGPWRFSARELRALAALKTGDAKTAKDLYRQLADNADAPQSLRARAAEMLAVLGG